MSTRPAVVMDSGAVSSRPTPNGRPPPTDATDHQLREAARFVISPDGHADDANLQAAFKLLRADAPVLWVDTPGMRPFWLLSRHGDISKVERRGAPFTAAPRTFLTSRMAEERLERILGKPYVLRGLLQMDDPDHAAYRAVAQPWFTPPALAAMEPWLESWADHIVSRVARRTDPFDFTKEIAVPFSIRGIMRLLGLPEADDDLILKLSWGLTGPEDPVRRLADHPTTAICRAGFASLIDTAIEEMLRWTTPGRHIVRTAKEEIELGGQMIRAGEAVALFFNSANRDETVFANADQFQIDRRPNPHLAFGLGQHHCVGAHLARREMRALLKTLLPRLESVELAAPPRRTCSTMVSGISSLSIRCAWRAPDL